MVNHELHQDTRVHTPLVNTEAAQEMRDRLAQNKADARYAALYLEFLSKHPKKWKSLEDEGKTDD